MWRSARNVAVILFAALSLSGSATAQHKLDVRVSGTVFEITVPDNELTVTDADLQIYIEHAANSIIRYFGAFPLKHVNIHIRAVKGDCVRFGRTTPEAGGTIMMMIGRTATADTLNSDWTLTHEMCHLSFPAVKGDGHDWLEEGMATYVEPIARTQAGYLAAAYVWNQFVRSMPKGLPQSGDRGLDLTPTWGRTYWGGALFCLLADVEIRKQTHNRRGIQDAFRAFISENGNMEWEWSIEKIVETGDRATGTHVLEKLYSEWKDKPVDVDLDQLWRDLGVQPKGDSVVFNDDAPLAPIRKAITSPH
jgi:hypothetical protein